MKKSIKYFPFFLLIFLIFLSRFLICSETLRVHFIDVGQGDSILIQSPDGINILIDAGNLSAGYKVNRYLESRKISRLECIIITHMHPDHVGGVFNILPKNRTNIIYYNGFRPQNNEFFFEIMNFAEELNIPVKVLKAGNKLTFGNVTVDVLWPLEPFSGNMNEDSIVLKIIYGRVNFLLTGDLNMNGEKKLMQTGYNLKSDVLKIGHHGAEDSNSAEFIDSVMPEIAVLSVGQHNRYGYPSEEVIQRFRSKKIKLYRTDFNGNIITETDGTKIQIKKEK